MRFLQAGLNRLAASAPEGPLRRLMASLAKAAGLQEDQFARASYLEGVMGYSPGTMTKTPRQTFGEIRQALIDGTDNAIVSTLQYEKGMSSKDILAMVGNKDLGIFDALKWGAGKAMKGSGGIRGLTPEDIAMAIAAGISPLTGQHMKYGPGKGVFYWLGEKSPSQISVRGISSIVGKEAYNRALDVVRGARKEETFAVPLEKPVGRGESPLTLSEVISGGSSIGRADFVDLAAAVYQDPWAMGIIDSNVRSNLRGPVQVAVWEAIKADPSLIIVSSNKIGVQNKALAEAMTQASGEPFSPESSGKIFRERVLPAMVDSLDNPAIAGRLLKNREILEIMQEATQSRKQDDKIRRIPYSGDEDPALQYGPYSLPRNTPGIPRPQKREVPRWLQKLKSDPGMRALMGTLSAERVASRYVKAFRLPPRDRVLYQKAKAWGEDNWDQFSKPDGGLYTDGLARGMAKALKKPFLAEDPAHWVYEIAYNIERASRRL